MVVTSNENKEFQKWVAHNIETNARYSCEDAYSSFKKEYGYKDNIKCPFSNDVYFNIPDKTKE